LLVVCSSVGWKANSASWTTGKGGVVENLRSRRMSARRSSPPGIALVAASFIVGNLPVSKVEADGNLYATASEGGTYHAGVVLVFEVTPN
jgi:hypothetical protein